MIKMICLLTRKSTLSHDEFMKHWTQIHGPLAGHAKSVRRYVQCHIRQTASRPDIPDIAMQIDGVAELWFDDMQALADSQHDEGMRRLLADGALFIGEIKTYIVEEKEIVSAGA